METPSGVLVEIEMDSSVERYISCELEALLECAICMEPLKEPRTLPCFHNFCKICLTNYVAGLRGENIEQFPCPTCRSQFTLKSNENVEGMPGNYFISNMLEVMSIQQQVKTSKCQCCGAAAVSRCIDCEMLLCQNCSNYHGKFPSNKKHTVLSLSELNDPEGEAKIKSKLYCKKHEDEALKFYCKTCKVLICTHCLVLTHNKQNHSCVSVEEIAQKQRDILQSKCETIDERLSEGKNALDYIAGVKKSLLENVSTAKKKIREQKENILKKVLEKLNERTAKKKIREQKENILKKVAEKLDEREKEIVKEVDDSYEELQNELRKQHDEIKQYVDKVQAQHNDSTINCESENKNKTSKDASLEMCSPTEIQPDNSITIDENGAIFDIPKASAFLIFPPNAVVEPVTLTCDRVMYEDCKVKPEDGEAFVSRILKIEPDEITFQKPVTVLLTHSAYEDQDFFDFYDLIVETVNPAQRIVLETERINNIEEVPEEIFEEEDLDDCLPFAKATITETCTIVVATRVKFDQILIKTDECFTFFQKYGENKELEIIFPKGVVDQPVWLKVQLFPPHDVFSGGICLDKNLVCVPVIKVSDQNKPFLEPVHVQLSYTHNDVLNICQDFLPVGEEKIRFTTEYGLLLRSQQKGETESKWMTFNDHNKVYIERPREDQLKFSFSVEHFSNLAPVMKTSADAEPPSVEEKADVYQSNFVADVLAVHERNPEKLYAILAPRTAKREVKEHWGFIGSSFGATVKSKESIFFCVPLSDSVDNYHLPIKDHTLWFDEQTWSHMPNDVSVDLRGKFMRFLRTKSCNGYNHSSQGDYCRAKVEINVIPTRSIQINHSQRTRETPLKTWLLPETDGNVVAGHCYCMAGLSEACSHVGALLYAIEAGVRMTG